MLHVVILTKRCESGKMICLRSTIAKLGRDNERRIVCLPVAVNHSITYHRQMARVRIRLARSDDSRALADLRYRFRNETESATETKSRFLRRCTSWMRKRFRSGSSPWRCWVLDDGKQLLGHVCVQLFEKIPNPVNDEPELHAYVTNFYVVPEMRSHGLGKRLLNKAVSWCRARGTDAVILWATPGSKTLYRRCGFIEPADIFELRRSSER
jgi:GNAT superfamily N-acetyltransferase